MIKTFFRFLINSNVFIASGAVLFTWQTQAELALPVAFHPYILLIFFATLFEYNLHRFFTLVKNSSTLLQTKHDWLRKNRIFFYFLFGFSVFGFLCTALFAAKLVLALLIPLGAATLLYSLPVKYRLRQIPIAKIFIIALVWAASVVLLPVIQSKENVLPWKLILIFLERFVFIIAITIPFDIRDMKHDEHSGLVTIPILIGEKKALRISNVLLVLFAILGICNHPGMLMSAAILISAAFTLLLVNNKKLQSHPDYHYGFLDGSIHLQAILVLGAFFLDRIN